METHHYNKDGIQKPISSIYEIQAIFTSVLYLCTQKENIFKSPKHEMQLKLAKGLTSFESCQSPIVRLMIVIIF